MSRIVPKHWHFQLMGIGSENSALRLKSQDLPTGECAITGTFSWRVSACVDSAE